MNYGYGGYNPIQARMESLMQQKQMIEQQMNSLQGMNVPAININNNTTPSQPQTNYDGNFKWVDGEEQARQVANNNLPLILFDNNNPMFYMKNVDGSFKKFRFEEVIDAPVQTVDPQIENRMTALEGKLNDILTALSGQSTQSQTNTQAAEKTPQTAPKQTNRGASK